MASIWHEVWIAADRETVFAALTTKEGLDGWWGKALRAEPTLWSVVELDHGLDQPLRLEITDIVPDVRVVWRFLSEFSDPTNPASEWLGQSFTFELEPRQEVKLLGAVQDVTILRLVNSGWPEHARWRGFCNTAWGVTLEVKLKEYCETGAASSGVVGEG